MKNAKELFTQKYVFFTLNVFRENCQSIEFGFFGSNPNQDFANL